MENFLSQNQWLVILLLIWSLTLKGLALWKSAQRKEKIWFVILLVVNTVGILEIIYLLFFGKKNIKSNKSTG